MPATILTYDYDECCRSAASLFDNWNNSVPKPGPQAIAHLLSDLFAIPWKEVMHDISKIRHNLQIEATR